MILNEAKVIFTATCYSGFNIIIDNLQEQHKKDIKNSYYTYDNIYFKHYRETHENYKLTGTLYPVHFSRQFFDTCFLGDREEFFYATIVRNPWSQSLSYARSMINQHGLKLNISFTLDYKQQINDIILKAYRDDYYKAVLQPQCLQIINSYTDTFDYDYILYFEDIRKDLKALSKLSDLQFNEYINIKHQPIDYREYLTQETIDVIAKLREADCFVFGYDFDKGLLFKNNQPKNSKIIKTQF